MESVSIPLSPWQKKQAALLYHFASRDYLNSVKARIDTLLGLPGEALGKAAAGKRHAGRRGKQRGKPAPAPNVGSHPWGAIGSFQVGLTADIAQRPAHVYNITGRNQCARLLGEYGMQWSKPEEEAMFDDACARASHIDATMNRLGLAGGWDDFGLTMAWQEHAHALLQIPTLRVREDVFADSGVLPPRTGVYLCADDTNATLQFAWTGGGRGKLLQSSTFNALGEAALAAVGRSRLWLDGPAMLDFVKAHANHRDLRSDAFFDDSQTPELAPSLLARQAFTARPCRWHYVEMIQGEFEDIGRDDPSTLATL